MTHDEDGIVTVCLFIFLNTNFIVLTAKEKFSQAEFAFITTFYYTYIVLLWSVFVLKIM